MADLDRVGRVADLVVATRRRGEHVVVVVSAMGKTTEGLIELGRRAACLPTSREDAEAEPPRRELDMLVSTGERVSMAILSIAIQARGLSAVSFTGSQSGIITDDRHFDARIIEVRPHRIEAELGHGKIVIVAGYQGMSKTREITTLGRGGSDTSAVALAAALGADRCEIYSDVDGVYTADPNHVAEAQHLPEIDYFSMQKIAEAGARVLNARAVEWAKAHGVTIHARHAHAATMPGRDRETRILEQPTTPPLSVISADRNVVLLSAERKSSSLLLLTATAAGLPLRSILVEKERIFASATRGGAPDLERARNLLAEASITGLSIQEDQAELSAIGQRVNQDPDRVARALEVIEPDARLVLKSPLTLSAVLPLSALARAEVAWHRLFVESV